MSWKRDPYGVNVAAQYLQHPTQITDEKAVVQDG